MTFTYTWFDQEETMLEREDADGNKMYFSADPRVNSYQEYLASGVTANPYVEPPVVPFVSPLEARIAAIEANEISDDATDSALLSLIAGLAARIAALEGGN